MSSARWLAARPSRCRQIWCQGSRTSFRTIFDSSRSVVHRWYIEASRSDASGDHRRFGRNLLQQGEELGEEGGYRRRGGGMVKQGRPSQKAAN